jgi:hypothetical protein
MLDAEAPKEYLVAHIEEALTKDGRLSEQGLHVTIEADPLVVTVSGVLSHVTHKGVVAEVIEGLLPAARLDDRTTTADYPEPTAIEGSR